MMNNKFSLLNILISALMIASFFGCSGVKSTVSNDFHLKYNPVRVAILPFDINKKYAHEEEVVLLFRKAFYNHFSYLGYIDKDIKEIDETLKNNKLNSNEEIYIMSSEKLGRLLNVDALIYCKIQKISNFTAGIYAETSIHANLKMVDSQSGSILWEADSKDIDRSSIVESGTLISLIQKQVKNSKKYEALEKVANEISKKIVKTIPDPSTSAGKINRPKINALNARVSNESANKGFLLEVFLSGEKEMKASFDIGDWKTGIPMEEKQPGDYAGSYLIKPTDTVKEALIMGKLENSYGLISKKIYERGLAKFGPEIVSRHFSH